MRSLGLLICVFLLAPVVEAKKAEAPSARQEKVFFSLLDAYKKYPKHYSTLSNGKASFPELNRTLFRKLPSKIREARFDRFNRDYINYRKLEKKTQSELSILNSRLENTPVSDLKVRGDLELKVKALSGRAEQIAKLIFLHSVEANTSISAAMDTLPQSVMVAEADQAERPKLPGVYGGGRIERERMKQIDKINLTPVDTAFYNTQLGKKLEKDLGGRADYWSYDFESDELYASVNGAIGKLRVRQDSPGVRYIQTRVGPRFRQPVGADEKIQFVADDGSTVKGKFLTGKESDETLFGEMPKADAGLSDLPAGHSPMTATTTIIR